MQLIRAKLYPPRLSPDLVPRPRLVQQLNAGLARKLSLVSAPAGFGKTTLLSEWAQQASCPVAWVTFDDDDNDLHSFLTYFVAAIESVYPHSCEQTQSLLNVASLPPLNALVALLANELSLLAGELIVILDDYHTLQAMAIHNLLERLIAYLPPAFHLVLGTRNSPPLPLVTLRAQGQLCELRQPNLRFTIQETRAFFDQAGQVALDEEMLKELDQRTEGWAAGLRLLLLSMAGYDDLRSVASRFTLAATDIMSFLTEQVLAKQSPAVLHFLLCTAIFERFTLSLYRVLAPESGGDDEGDALLAQVLRGNLFVVALGEGWYRYYALFRELLLHHQERQIGRQGLDELHHRAGSWFEQNGMVGDAIRHALQAGDEELAIAVLVRHRIAAMNREQWQQLEHWLAFFPPQLVEQQPLLSVTQAWLYHIQYQLGKYMAILPRVEWQLAEGKPLLDAATRLLVEGELCALKSQVFFFQGEFQPAAASAQRSLERLPFAHSKGRALASHFLVLGLNHSGDQAAAQAALQTGLDDIRSHGDNFGPWIMLIKFVMGYLAMDTLAMEESSSQMVEWAQARVLPESNLWAHYYLGWLAYTRNELDVAYQHFEQVVAERYVVHVGAAASSYTVLALICQARGDGEEALHVVETAAAFVRESSNPDAMHAYEAVRAFLALLQGRTHEAMAWAENQVDPPLLVPTVMSTREAPLVLLKTLVSSSSGKSLARVAALLPSLLESARTAHAHFLTAELLALQARLCQHLGEPEEALAHLTAAITLVSHARPLRLFADLGLENSRSLIPLLEQLNRRNLAPEYLPQALEVLAPLSTLHAAGASQKLPDPIPSTELVEPLTQREIEILMLIEQGMSNKQIGQQLFISDKTVENHTTNIFQKLGVRNRTQAARRANELRLLPPH